MHLQKSSSSPPKTWHQYTTALLLPLSHLLTTTILFPVSLNLTMLGISYKWNQTVFTLCYWLISLNVTPSSSIHVVTRVKICLFLWLSKIPLCIYQAFFIHLSIDNRWQLWNIFLWKRMCEYLFKSLLLFLLGVPKRNSIVKSVDYIVSISLIFGIINTPISIAIVPFQEHKAQGFQFLHTLAQTYFPFSLSLSRINNHCNCCEVVSNCRLDLHVPND